MLEACVASAIVICDKIQDPKLVPDDGAIRK
jgi:hypothetical protein